MNVKRKTENLIDRLLNTPVYVNILAALVVFSLIVYFILKYIDVYTNHNKAVVVPDVKGFQIEAAEPFFRMNNLKYAVVDSVYAKEVSPGTIVEMMPEANSRVKKNRTIYIIINAKTEKKIAIPDVKDISYREAFALLRTRGFMDIERKYVSGEYLNLTIGVQYGGRMIQSGTRVPASAKLILVISDGTAGYQDDSTSVNDNSQTIEGDESWF
jgi:beta-lactam-binding protein with PASTA domain